MLAFPRKPLSCLKKAALVQTRGKSKPVESKAVSLWGCLIMKQFRGRNANRRFAQMRLRSTTIFERIPHDAVAGFRPLVCVYSSHYNGLPSWRPILIGKDG